MRAFSPRTEKPRYTTAVSGPPNSGATRRVGRYALHGEIASGGMATVHYGRLIGSLGFSRTVAIKRLHVHLAKDPEFVSMLLDEARIAARIQHPNVVPTLDVVTTDDEIFLVMEYVQGESLARLLRAASALGQPIPTEVIVTVLVSVLHGLHAAHEAKNERGEPLGVVHRDVSPHNVMVGVDGVARVLDFGVAKATGRLQTTRQGQLKGKLAYMAPEQIHGTTTRATDIFAASIVLWEALARRRLFDGENEAAVLAKVISAPIVPPSAIVGALPEGLDAIVMRGLERDPGARFATAREMARALERCVPHVAASDIGELVESLAARTLADRSEKLARIESNSNVDARALSPVVVSAGTSEPPPVPIAPVIPSEPIGDASRSHVDVGPFARKRRWPFVAGAAGVVVVALLLLRGVVAGEDAKGAATPAASVTAPASATPAPEPAAPPPSAPASESTAPAPTPSPSVAPPRKPTPGVPAGTKPSCSPPFTVDASGYKHYKKECLR